ncbi:MAG: penicillin-binding protein, partial [Desulfamplus sp.]|nr:penicillin-binding protein [Desulfamplus sp.]
AEVACGFNKTTTISPVFGAMIASTMLNSGKTPVPSIVESVTDTKAGCQTCCDGNRTYNADNQTNC